MNDDGPGALACGCVLALVLLLAVFWGIGFAIGQAIVGAAL